MLSRVAPQLWLAPFGARRIDSDIVSWHHVRAACYRLAMASKALSSLRTCFRFACAKMRPTLANQTKSRSNSSANPSVPGARYFLPSCNASESTVVRLRDIASDQRSRTLAESLNCLTNWHAMRHDFTSMAPFSATKAIRDTQLTYIRVQGSSAAAEQIKKNNFCCKSATKKNRRKKASCAICFHCRNGWARLVCAI